MAVPVIESFAVNSSPDASTTLTCDKPTGVEADDLLVLIGYSEDNTAGPMFTDNKSGWTFVQNAGGSTPDCHIGLFWKIATGSEPSSESITQASSDQWGMHYIRISGVDTENVVEVTGSPVTGGQNLSITGVTTANDDCLVLYCNVFDGGDGTPFSPSGAGFTEKDEFSSGPTGNYDVSGSFGWKNMTSQGDSGTVTVSANVSDGTAGFQIAFKGDSEAPPAALYSGRGIGRGIGRGFVR
jgi:hypothetical protein